MILYLFFYIQASIFSFCYSKSKDKNLTMIFGLLTFMSLFLPLALRYGIGTDYDNYVRIAQNVIRSGINDRVELGWTPLFLLIRNFNLDVHWFFVIPAFFSSLIILKVVPKKYLWFCIPPYICIYWIESFSLVRQAFAASIFLLAFYYFVKRKYFPFFVWAIISIFFHKSMVVIFALTLLSLFSWRIFTPLLNFIFIIGFYVLTRFINIGKILMEVVVGNTMYANYVSSQFNKTVEGGSGMGLYFRLIIFIILLVIPFVSYKKLKSPITNDGYLEVISKRRKYNLLCLYVFALAAGHILAYQIHIFNRIPNIFSIFYVFFAYELINVKSKYRKLVTVLFQLIIFILFLASLNRAEASSGGGLGIVPYQSILWR